MFWRYLGSSHGACLSASCNYTKDHNWFQAHMQSSCGNGPWCYFFFFYSRPWLPDSCWLCRAGVLDVNSCFVPSLKLFSFAEQNPGFAWCWSHLDLSRRKLKPVSPISHCTSSQCHRAVSCELASAVQRSPYQTGFQPKCLFPAHQSQHKHVDCTFPSIVWLEILVSQKN